MGASRTRSEYLKKPGSSRTDAPTSVPPAVSLTAHLAGSRSSPRLTRRFSRLPARAGDGAPRIADRERQFRGGNG
jgi:hypothetical protein